MRRDVRISYYAAKIAEPLDGAGIDVVADEGWVGERIGGVAEEGGVVDDAR